MDVRDNLRPGTEAIYEEDAMFVKVKILQNLSDDSKIAYSVRVLEIIKENGMYEPFEKGHEFYCSRVRGPMDSIFGGICWNLYGVEVN